MEMKKLYFLAFSFNSSHFEGSRDALILELLYTTCKGWSNIRVKRPQIGAKGMVWVKCNPEFLSNTMEVPFFWMKSGNYR